MRAVISVAGVLLALCAHADRQAEVDARVSQALDAIERAVASSRVPGMVIGVTDRQKTLKVIAHGYADLKTRAPLTAESRFAIGSISKSMTAVALMQLLDAGRFDPQAPIARYLPWFKVNSRFEPISGHDLLSHTAGLPYYFADLSSSRYAAYVLREFEPSYAPGAHHWYSNTGFQILGYAMESIERAPYHTLIERRIFQPLGMNASVAVIDDSQRAKLPVSYVRWPYDEEYVEAPWFEYSAADGSVVSTAADMSAYARLVLNRGATSKGRLISVKAFELLTTPVLDDYAYGFYVRRTGDDTIISHSGGMAGFRSLLQAHMNDGYAVVFLSNGGLDRKLNQWIIETLSAAYRGQPPIEPPAPASSASLDVSKYAGVYRGGDGKALQFVVAGGHLALERDKVIVPLIRMGEDRFRTPTDDSNAYPFIFGRASAGEAAKVVEVSHGSLWYTSDDYAGAKRFSAPPEYLAYVGHYENHNAEGPSVRVFIRNGRLMALAEGEVPDSGVLALEAVQQGVFRPANPAYNPERYRFDTLIDGLALRLNISGTLLYRVDTQ